MKRWFPIVLGSVTLAVSGTGCEPPEQILPTAPPGAVVVRTLPEGEEAPTALGESPALTAKSGGEVPNKPAPYTPALPTALGETKTTPGGVKYETLKEGDGDELKPGQVALFEYVGTLEDGTEFDASRRSGKPLRAVLGTRKLILGWEEALPGMKVGEKRKLVIPPELGYGAQGNGPVPPNATLIFEITLNSIVN